MGATHGFDRVLKVLWVFMGSIGYFSGIYIK